MNSLGKSSKWPSYDSLRSNSSFLPSESEQTEDETDFFSEGEGDSGLKVSLPADEAITPPGDYISFPPHPERLRPASAYIQSELYPDKSQHPDPGSSPGAAELRSPSTTPGDLAFAQKVSSIKVIGRPLKISDSGVVINVSFVVTLFSVC